MLSHSFRWVILSSCSAEIAQRAIRGQGYMSEGGRKEAEMGTRQFLILLLAIIIAGGIAFQWVSGLTGNRDLGFIATVIVGVFIVTIVAWWQGLLR